MSRRELLINIAKEVGLGRHAEKLASASADCVRLFPEVVAESDLPLGASRLGGIPDLPPGFSWPMWPKGPLAFIAQIALEDLAAFPVSRLLPNVGWLSFFYNSEQDTWGFDPKDAGSFGIYYTPPGPLVRTPAPGNVPGHARYASCRVQFQPDIAFPETDSPEFRQAGISRLSREAVEAFQERLNEEVDWSARTMLFGSPDQIQGEMREECALVTAGLYCGDPASYRDSRAAQLRKSATDWQLLFQVASEDAAGMMWGDLGCLYYWIRREDLAGRHFDRSWLILQCS